jgi:trk system potassium uptake protein
MVYSPEAEQPLEVGDELLFVAAPESEPLLEELLNPGR